MSEFDLDVLSVIGEAVLIARGEKIVFANSPAVAILGGKCIGKRVSTLLGTEISGMQADDFTANTGVNGKNCIIRATKRNREQIFVIKEVSLDNVAINDAFLYALRESLMIMSMSASRFRAQGEKTGNTDMLDMADSLNKSISSASRIMANITVVRGIQNGTVNFTPEPVDISGLFAEYTDIVSALIPNVKIDYEAPAGLQAKVDPALMKNLLSNLISNAVLHGKCARIHVRLIDSKETVVLAVDDDGCGIEMELLYNVFERYCGPMELSDMSRGAGIGLSAAMGIARLHGGTMLLESRVGRGTAVRVSLCKNGGKTALHTALASAEDVKDFITGLSDCEEQERFREVYADS